MKWFKRNREEISVTTAPVNITLAQAAVDSAVENLRTAAELDVEVEAITDKLDSLRVKNHFAERIEKAMKGT